MRVKPKLLISINGTRASSARDIVFPCCVVESANRLRCNAHQTAPLVLMPIDFISILYINVIRDRRIFIRPNEIVYKSRYLLVRLCVCVCVCFWVMTTAIKLRCAFSAKWWERISAHTRLVWRPLRIATARAFCLSLYYTFPKWLTARASHTPLYISLWWWNSAAARAHLKFLVLLPSKTVFVRGRFIS